MNHGNREINKYFIYEKSYKIYLHAPCMKMTRGNFKVLKELAGFNSMAPKRRPANEKEGGVHGETKEREKVESESLSPCQDQSSPWHIWDLIGSSLVQLFCLLLLFGAYTWSELT